MWQPVPGSTSDRVPVEINEAGSTPTREQEDTGAIDYHHVAVEEDIDKYRVDRHCKADDVRVHAKDTAKYGFTLGCRTCQYNRGNRKVPVGMPNSAECRRRIKQAMEQDEEDQERVKRFIARKPSIQAHLSTESQQSPLLPLGGRETLDSRRHVSVLENEMRMAMMKLVVEEIDVAKIYSPAMNCEKS